MKPDNTFDSPMYSENFDSVLEKKTSVTNIEQTRSVICGNGQPRTTAENIISNSYKHGAEVWLLHLKLLARTREFEVYS